MTFKFNAKTDYYEMFEACMNDEDWISIADDCCDYDEFINALKSGEFIPKD